MEKYENMDNIRKREHKVKVTIQLGECKGTLIGRPIGGNCFGLDILNCIDEDMIYDIDEYEKVNCSIELIGKDDDGEDWFKITFINENGDETEFEEECRYFKKLIVGLEICECNIMK